VTAPFVWFAAVMDILVRLCRDDICTVNPVPDDSSILEPSFAVLVIKKLSVGLKVRGFLKPCIDT
jgi:hypothetical protein